MRTKTLLGGLALLRLGVLCAGEPPVPQMPCAEVPLAPAAPAMEASLNDPVWDKGVEIGPLTLSPGCKGEVPLQKTRVRLLWDRRYLYVRFVCEDDDIQATLSGHDAEYSREDVAEVFLDPVGDEKAYIELQVSPNNGVRDVLYLCTGEPKADDRGMQPAEFIARDVWTFADWTFEGLRTASGRFEEGGRRGWIVELALPANCLRRLGLKEFNRMKLRANFVRLDRPADPAHPGACFLVSSNWSPIPAGRPHRAPAANGYLMLTN